MESGHNSNRTCEGRTTICRASSNEGSHFPLPSSVNILSLVQVLFLIPKNSPPTLEGNFSKSFREFVACCLQRDPRDVRFYSWDHPPSKVLLTPCFSAPNRKRIVKAQVCSVGEENELFDRTHRPSREMESRRRRKSRRRGTSPRHCGFVRLLPYLHKL